VVAIGGGSSGSPKWVRIFRIGPGSLMNEITRMSPPQFGHSSGNSSPARAMSVLAPPTNGECRDGPPQLVIPRKHPVVAMPVLPRRRDEIGEPVEELKRREPDDAISSRPRRRPPAQLAGVSTPGPGVAPSLARATLVIENGSIHGGRPAEVPLAGLSLKYFWYWPQKAQGSAQTFWQQH
jgi:hypothetical protein